MKIELGGKRYKIGFAHIGSPGTLERHTLCTIRDENNEIVQVGRAYLHPKDNFCKAAGRRAALARTIAYFCPEDRKAIWEQYFREHNDLQKREILRLTPETLEALLELTK